MRGIAFFLIIFSGFICAYTVQATDILAKDGTVYVGYNDAGEEHRGGIQICTYTKDTSRTGGYRINYADYPNTLSDTNGLCVYNDQLYTAESVNEYPNYAQIGRFDLRLKKHFSGLVKIPAPAAVDIEIYNGFLYAAYGAAHGGIAKIKIPANLEDAYTIQTQTTEAINDIRSIAIYNGRLYVLKGGALDNAPAIIVLDPNTLEATMRKELTTTGLNTAETKATIQVKNGTAAISAGKDGAYLFDADTLSEKKHLELQKKNIFTQAVCNGITFDGDLYFLAGGEYIQAVKLNSTGDITDIFPLLNDKSANMVFFQDRLLFAASGRGGVKVIKVSDALFNVGADGTIVTKTKTKITATVIGTEYTYPDGSRAPMFMKKKLDSLYSNLFGGQNINKPANNSNSLTSHSTETFTVPQATSIVFQTSAEGKTIESNAKENGIAVEVLENGEAVPGNMPNYEVQQSLCEILYSHKMAVEDKSCASGYRVNIDSTQAIVVYDFNANNDGKDDLNDCIILVNFESIE